MNDKFNMHIKLKAYTTSSEEMTRILDPLDINIPPAYQIEVFAYGLDAPGSMIFSRNGDLYVADTGLTSNAPKVLRMVDDHFDIIADNFNAPINGISYMDGDIYVSHKGRITVLRENGTRQDIISGLPCNGDNGLSNVAFGPDGKIYFSIGTSTNSGVVGNDNAWVFDHPLLHDDMPFDFMVRGQNFITPNMLINNQERVSTGAFSSYGIQNSPYEVKKGVMKASGCILRANRDGTDLEPVAWGFRNPLQMSFNREYQLFLSNRSYDVRGSRPIANASDEFYQVIPGLWYGWPDYAAGEPVTLPKFRPEGGVQPEFLLAGHPNVPPMPFATFPPHSTITGFDFDYTNLYGAYGDIFITEFGSYGSITQGQSAPFVGIGHRISKIDRINRQISTFINNKSGLPAFPNDGGGLGRPVDLIFGPDNYMYILDMGINRLISPNRFIPNTGVIWRVRPV
ncbi:MAG: repeat containing protein [Herbinix sp.]|jgi:glucose/arabinose dehydrogenase|nr:repeat containing protein [Herbinix sp.]